MPAITDPAPAPVDDASLVAARPTCSPAVAAIARLSMAEVLARLTPERLRGAIAVIGFIGAPLDLKPSKRVAQLCQLLIEAGVPIDRYGSSTTMVTSEHDAVGRLWRRGEAVEDTIYVSPEAGDPEYLASPYRLAAETQRWVELWLPATPDTRFGVVASLKAQGYIHYVCIPYRLYNQADGWTTFATKRAEGFSEDDFLTLAFILPTLVSRIDGWVGWTSLDKLLRTYVGDEPHTAILAGRAKRGQVSTIEAAMLVADLRDSTGHTADVSALQAVGLFNDLFDCLVPPVEARRGEVLKYLGDGLLAMFRQTDGEAGACDRALAAAEAALAAIAAHNRAHPERRPMEIGIALHYGLIAYGNVGSGARLDFTVIGRDVGLASRIAGMNAMLEQPLLISAPFAAHLAGGAVRLGAYPARGFQEPVDVFRPAAPATIEASSSHGTGLPT